MRAELEGILTGRYGENVLRSVMLVEPTKKHLDDYTRHLGLVNFWIDLSRSPHLVVVDTGNLIHLRHAWIGRRQSKALMLFVSSGIQQLSRDPKVQTYAQRVEGLELTFHYRPQSLDHRREIPYKAELKPLW